jgi:ATP-dependent Lon protease
MPAPSMGTSAALGNGSRLLPVLPLDDVCLLPGASLSLVLQKPVSLAAVQLASRTGDSLLALARRDAEAGPRELHAVGTIAAVRGLHAVTPL